MFYFENYKGEKLDVSFENDGISIVDIQGIGVVNTINTSSISGYDGAAYISEQVPMRNITMILLLDDETDKRILYTIFSIKKIGTLYYKSDFRDVKIECHVEKIDIPSNTFPMKAQISLLCSQPYFESLEVLQKSIAAVIPMFRFPFTFSKDGFKFSEKTASVMVNVINESEVDVGMKIVFYANSEVVNPSLLNADTGEIAKLNFTMQAGDTITINTHTGKKRITLLRNGVESNIFNYKAAGFRFMQLHQGDNLFRYNADSNLSGLEVTIYYSEYYSGV